MPKAGSCISKPLINDWGNPFNSSLSSRVGLGKIRKRSVLRVEGRGVMGLGKGEKW